jgi:hypothetical protein
MLEAATVGGGKAFVGLQGRQSPIVKKVKELIDSGRIGSVLSSNFFGAATNDGGEEGKTVSYFTDRRVGGNMFSIAFGHSKDYPSSSIEFYFLTNLLQQLIISYTRLVNPRLTPPSSPIAGL